MKYFDESTLQQIKIYGRENIELYQDGTIPWVIDYLDLEKSSQHDSCHLMTGPDSPTKYDINNAQLLYEEYKDIPIELASEESFWSYLTHTKYWRYMIKRWPVTNNENRITNQYFFGKNKPFYRNGLSRLWWYAHITYNPEMIDPYYYTKIALKDQERAALLLETVNLSRNRVALFATLDILSKIDEWKENNKISHIKNERNVLLRPLMQYVNSIGGVMIWDILSQEEAKEKMMIFIDQLIEGDIIVEKEKQEV